MKVGVIAGNFDVLHPGYIKMFKEAKENCDELIVLLHDDPSLERPEKTKPLLSIEDRAEVLMSIKYIDKIKTYSLEKDLHDLLVSLSPDIRFIGDDYKGKTDYTGYGICPKVYYFDRSHGWSATKYKKMIYEQVRSRHDNGA